MKRFFLLFLILISLPFLFSQEVLAAPSKKIGIGPIRFYKPDAYPDGTMTVDFQTSLGSSFSHVSRPIIGCGSGSARYICIDYFEIDTPDDTNAITIAIAGIKRVVNGFEDQNGYFVMTQGIATIPPGGERNQNNWTWRLYPRGETKEIKFEWRPQVGLPQINIISPKTLPKDNTSTFYINVVFPPPVGPKYIIDLTKTLVANPTHQTITVACQQPSTPPGQCRVADQNSSAFKYLGFSVKNNLQTLEFTIKTSEGSIINNSQYTLTVKTAINTQVTDSIAVRDDSTAGPLRITIAPDTFTQEQLSTTPAVITLANGEKDQEYSIILNKREAWYSSEETERVLDRRFQCQQAGCSKTVSLASIGLPPGTYPITVTSFVNGEVFGIKTITIQSRPTPPGPPASPTPLPRPTCTAPAGYSSRYYKQCGDAMECNGQTWEHERLIGVCEYTLGDDKQYECTPIGIVPGECEVPLPSVTPFPCPVCPDDHPRWDPPGDLNGRCCEKDGKPGECKSPVPKIRKDDCEPGIPCGFGIGCGLGTRGPCGKKLDEKGNPTDAFTCDTAIGTFDVTPQAFVKRLFGLLLGVSGGVALLLILYSSYRLMMSRGDPEKLQGARETLTSAIVGLIFIIFSLVILEIVGVDILRIPTLGR